MGEGLSSQAMVASPCQCAVKPYLGGMGKTREYIATTLGGLEPVLEEELIQFGAQRVQAGQRFVRFEGPPEMLYQACYGLRTALRVLEPLSRFRIRSEKDLYNQVVDLPWRKILGPDQTFAITPVVRSSLFNHSNYPSLVMKDALCDRIRKETGRRPSVDKDYPDIRFNLHITEDEVDISLDAVGGSMHVRGYRRFGGHAPLNEVLAAGMLRLAGWRPDLPLIDPMCGSATMLIEAGEMAIRRPSQVRRGRFGFQGWLDFDPGLWRRIKQSMVDQPPPPGLQLRGSDSDAEVLEGGRSNIRIAGLGEYIDTKVQDFFEMPSPKEPGMVFLNPPYDERIALPDAEVYYRRIGDKLKKDFQGCTAWVLSANIEALRQIGLKPAIRYPVFNGPLDAEFCRYDLY
jgi:putative N6-adenine-specific DNA methylase